MSPTHQAHGTPLTATPRPCFLQETSNTKFVKKASKHYAAVAKRAVAAGHAVDVFACALDQVGLMEMRPVLEKTGGYVVMSESFTGNIFKQSFKAVFARDSTGQYLKMAFGASVEVRASPPPGAHGTPPLPPHGTPTSPHTPCPI